MLQPRYDVIDIGTLGGLESDAVALNNNGQIVGHSDTSHTRDGKTVKKAYLWGKGQMTSLGEFKVKAMNNHGWIVGYKNPSEAVIWHDQKLVSLPPELTEAVTLKALNDRNEVVGWLQTVEKIRGNSGSEIKNRAFCFNLNDKNMRLLETLGDSKMSVAEDINNNGCIVGSIKQLPEGDGINHRSLATFWDEHGLTGIDPMPGFNESQAIDVNDNGQILCKAIYNHMEDIFDKTDAKQGIVTLIPPADDSSLFYQTGFVYNKGTNQLLCPDPNSFFHLNIPRTMNVQGQVVGTMGCGRDLSEKPAAFIFLEGEIYNLNDTLDEGSAWTLSDAKGINDHGQIVGIGRLGDARRGFLLNPK
jgi:probable HAF family extracellular repeat protein